MSGRRCIWLADEAGTSCQVIYLPVELDVQLARIAHRQATTPETFPMPEAAVLSWREKFQAPAAAELAGEVIPHAPQEWPTWPAWAIDRWPTLEPYAN